jgi:membrane-associated phospholipid phosphatase
MARPDAWKSDILVSALLALLAAYLEFQPPFERHLVPETLPRVSYPHRGEQTFPTWTLPFLGVIIPVSVILAASLVQTDSVARSRAETKRSIVGLLLAVTLGFAVTNALKNSVGAFRPDFRARCWPNGAKTAWEAPGIPKCAPNHDARLVSEGRKSFPSGHASMAFSGLSFASAAAAERLAAFGGGAESAAKRNRHRAPAWRLVAAAAPVALAVAVAVSRVTDYMHHVEDVVGGGCIGLAAAWAAWAAKRPFRRGGDGASPAGDREKSAKEKARGARGARRRRGEPGRAFVDHAPQ